VHRSDLFGDIDPPSPAELALLRDEIDVTGVLR